VNRVVRVVRGADQELRIECVISSVNNIALTKRIHVMDDQSLVNITPRYAEIARFISNDYLPTKLSPLSRPVKLLIDPPVETEGLVTNNSLKS